MKVSTSSDCSSGVTKLDQKINTTLTNIVKITILSDYRTLSRNEGERGRKRMRWGEKGRSDEGERGVEFEVGRVVS